MKIALVGGTGDIGNGFAVRWARDHEIILGSRRAEKAKESVSKIQEYLKGKGLQAEISGMDNTAAIREADVVVLCVPFETVRSVTGDLSDAYSDQIVVSPVVPMACSKYFEFIPPSEGCAAVMIKNSLPETVRIVSAFHTIPAASLQEIDRELKGDVPICGDDKESKDVVSALARDIRSLRPLDAGPLTVSRQVEGLTPMLLNIARLNKMRQVSIQFVQERPNGR